MTEWIGAGLGWLALVVFLIKDGLAVLSRLDDLSINPITLYRPNGTLTCSPADSKPSSPCRQR